MTAREKYFIWKKEALRQPGSPTRFESFYAGWKAHAEETANSRAQPFRTDERHAAEQVGRAIEKQCSRAEIMGRAYEAFRDGQDEKARLYRDLANELFGAPEPQSPLF